MSIPFALGDAADLIDVSIQRLWLKSSNLDDEDYKLYFNTESGVVDYYLKDSSISGLGQAARQLENAVITSESPIQNFDKTYTQVKFSKLLAVTEQMWKFGIKKRDLEKITGELRLACVRKREALGALYLDSAWSTSMTVTDDSGNYSKTISGGNSVALFSASQTREDGGTDNNNIVYDGTTYNMDMEYDALKALERTASLVRDPKGNLMNIKPDTIIVKRGSTAAFRYKEIAGAMSRNQLPGGNDNDGTAIGGYKLIELPYLANDAYWYAFDSSMKNLTYGPQWKESQPIMLSPANVVYKTDEIQYKSSLMADFGHNDYRGWFGSDGTNA